LAQLLHIIPKPEAVRLNLFIPELIHDLVDAGVAAAEEVNAGIHTGKVSGGKIIFSNRRFRMEGPDKTMNLVY
jgi:hypothetical protein